MANEKPAPAAPGKKGGTGFLFKHGEKVAAGVAGAVLAGFCGWAYAMPHDEEAITAISEFDSSIQPDSAKYQKEHGEKLNQLAAPETAGSWQSLASAKPVGPWTSAFKTSVTITERTEEAKVDAKQYWLLPAVQFGEAFVDHSGVRIDFSVTAPKLAPPQKDNKGRTVMEQLAAEVTGWVVERAVLDAKTKEGPWTVLEEGETFKISEEEVGEKPAVKKVWRIKDTGITPKTLYAYRLKPVGNPTIKGGVVVDVEFSAPKEARTVGDFRWVINALQNAKDGRVQIGLHVYKYERALDREVLGKLNHFEGDTIGVHLIDDITGEKVKVHPAYDPAKSGSPIKDPSGKPAKVDFDTGAKIVKIETIDLETEYQVCKIEIDQTTGAKDCKGVETKTEVFKATTHVLIVDDEKTEQHWWKSASKWTNEKPAKKGTMCPEHADPNEVAPPKPTPKPTPPPSTEKPKEPEQPKPAPAKTKGKG